MSQGVNQTGSERYWYIACLVLLFLSLQGRTDKFLPSLKYSVLSTDSIYKVSSASEIK